MSQYIPTLDYYSNSLPLVSPAYASSECFFGINLNPFCKPSEVAYTLIPVMCYFELLPVRKSNEVIDSISILRALNEKDEQQLIDLVDVKIGQYYELVVTTYSGLLSIQGGRCSSGCWIQEQRSSIQLYTPGKCDLEHRY